MQSAWPAPTGQQEGRGGELKGQTVKLTWRGVFLDERGNTLPQGDIGEGRKRTIAYRIMQKHNTSRSMEEPAGFWPLGRAHQGGTNPQIGRAHV